MFEKVKKEPKIRLRAASGPEKIADFMDRLRKGVIDHNDGAHWYVAEEGADWGWLPQYSHIRCDIAGTNAVNLNIVLTPFVA